MHLKSLALKGFKSFADRTTMVFDPGLTVVVGPNGSGKSNVSDAVLWVLGEQSARQLRGQAMEDVIFSGSSARSSVGLAEVTLVLDNTDHALPIDFAEVAITRRMYRSGESEYLINGAPCRLMDITDILHDTGLGKDTHSIISQGRLDSILTSRPEERRELIEEAAGIAKHRRRKARSERKLKAMDESLARAKDVAREISRQLRPLEQQVGKAQRHRELNDELHELEAALAVDNLRRLQERHARLTAQGREADAAVELAQLRHDERSRELDRYQSLLEKKGIFVGDLGEQRRRMQGLLGRMDSDMRLLEEKGKNMVARLSEMRMALSTAEHRRSEVMEEHERVVAELADARVRAANLERQVQELTRSVQALTDDKHALSRQQAQLSADRQSAQREADSETLSYAKLQDQIGNAEVEDQMFASRISQIEETLANTMEALTECERRQTTLDEDLKRARKAMEDGEEGIRKAQAQVLAAREADSSARERLQAATAMLSALEQVDSDDGHMSGRLASLLKMNRAACVEHRLSDVLQVATEYEALVERLLGDDLEALVVATKGDASALAEAASSLGEASGTVAIVSREVPVTQHASDDSPGVSLLDQVCAAADAEPLVESLFCGVRVTDTISEAIDAHAAAPGHTYLSVDGGMVLPDGRIVVGLPESAERGTLERKRRIRGLKEELPSLESSASASASALGEAERELVREREAHTIHQGEVSRMTAESRSLTAEMGRLDAQVTAARVEQAQVLKRREEAADRAKEARSEIDLHRKAAKRAQARVSQLADELEQVLNRRRLLNDDEEVATRLLSEAKLELATVAERRNHLAVREEQLTRTIRDLDARHEMSARSARSLEVLRLRVAPLHERYEAIRERALFWSDQLRDRSRLAAADSDSLKETINGARAAVSEATAKLDRARAASNEIKVEVGRLEAQVEAAITAITGAGYVLEDALGLPELEDRAQAEHRIERLHHQIAGIGPVNEVAMEEYSRLKERSDYIAEQVADLEAARKSLAKITAAIERKMRRQFLVVFDVVNANFSETFALLFPGGHAHLEMCDPDHPDETGIEVVAQPRGKRIQKMMLMSGGEKSLTALALLFATYKTRTVPFYIFDEVEAALDDSNLGKFLDAIDQLKGQTQLIVISHQRRTMEQADVLYGVSMQADGVSHVVSQRLDQTTGRVVDA